MLAYNQLRWLQQLLIDKYVHASLQSLVRHLKIMADKDVADQQALREARKADAARAAQEAKKQKAAAPVAVEPMIGAMAATTAADNDTLQTAAPPLKRGRGRPRKNPAVTLLQPPPLPVQTAAEAAAVTAIHPLADISAFLPLADTQQGGAFMTAAGGMMQQALPYLPATNLLAPSAFSQLQQPMWPSALPTQPAAPFFLDGTFAGTTLEPPGSAFQVPQHTAMANATAGTWYHGGPVAGGALLGVAEAAAVMGATSMRGVATRTEDPDTSMTEIFGYTMQQQEQQQPRRTRTGLGDITNLLPLQQQALQPRQAKRARA
ncbi:hypothetical protein CHLRE_08g358521v5 [Chlamydomonas reinhardtii]|uniref:Uncharacterized protein n=1 Tax=Chlamydomonas reinhardtii TaxID=3055 RepID=A0A2K3DG44_CHLRE|nr:uncharacterized protein CHLRE_08g358521v5 [Chlamydomonas reinhardtii]PNW79514.1 hypothetical protein CHLRE_08g358521v5 [Chlamydomonas reinhardtii]